MVPMERGHFPFTTIHPPTAEATGRVGLDQCRCEKSSITTLPLTNTKYRPRNIYGELVLEVETSDTGPNPPQIQRIPANIEYLRQFAMDGA